MSSEDQSNTQYTFSKRHSLKVHVSNNFERLRTYLGQYIVHTQYDNVPPN